jgi:hypothetical protein
VTETDNLPVVLTEKQQQAKNFYVENGGTLEGVSKAVGVPTTELVEWADEHGWRVARHEYVEAKYEVALDDYKGFIAEHRVPMLIQHLGTAQKLQENLDTCLLELDATKPGGDVKVERLTRAFASLIASTSRILSISEGVTDPLNKNAGGPSVLIMSGGHAKVKDVTQDVTIK